MTPSSTHKSAFVALIGRPNCGKSTLLNTIIGEELAVVTPLPQTTRRNLRGIFTRKDLQLIFVDTPGIHLGRHSLNRSMVEESSRLVKKRGVDIVCHIVDSSRQPGEEEDLVVKLTRESGIPAIVVFNKKDLCPSIDRFVASFYDRYPVLKSCVHLAISAIDKETKEQFLTALLPLVPEGPEYFPADDLTDADLRFFAAEYVRKHIIGNTKDEVPHAVFVEVRAYRESQGRHHVEVDLHVETDGQKAIIIGKKGALIQKIQRNAAQDLEKLTGVPAAIICHVKISSKWRDDERFLREMGFVAR
jgi:GTP-binding protein Era